MKCLDNNGDGGGGECCFSWSVDLDEWRTHHPDWGGDAERARRVLFVQIRGGEGDLLQKIVRIAMGGGGGGGGGRR